MAMLIALDLCSHKVLEHRPHVVSRTLSGPCSNRSGGTDA
jgi:hypothetical protein